MEQATPSVDDGPSRSTIPRGIRQSVVGQDEPVKPSASVDLVVELAL